MFLSKWGLLCKQHSNNIMKQTIIANVFRTLQSIFLRTCWILKPGNTLLLAGIRYYIVVLWIVAKLCANQMVIPLWLELSDVTNDFWNLIRYRVVRAIWSVIRTVSWKSLCGCSVSMFTFYTLWVTSLFNEFDSSSKQSCHWEKNKNKKHVMEAALTEQWQQCPSCPCSLFSLPDWSD